MKKRMLALMLGALILFCAGCAIVVEDADPIVIETGTRRLILSVFPLFRQQTSVFSSLNTEYILNCEVQPTVFRRIVSAALAVALLCSGLHAGLGGNEFSEFGYGNERV